MDGAEKKGMGLEFYQRYTKSIGKTIGLYDGKSKSSFIILKDNLLFLKDSTQSHLQWAMSLGIDESEFNALTRGYVLDGNIIFYKGNFDYDELVIKDANRYAKEIQKECSLINAKVYVGLEIGEIGSIYPPKQYLFDL